MRKLNRPTRTVAELPERWVDQDVFGMSAGGTLGFLVEQRCRKDSAAAAELRGVCAWADRHRISDPETDGYGAVDPEVGDLVLRQDLERVQSGHESRSFAGPDGIEGQLRLCGQNAYLVTEFALTEVASALAMSEASARRYVGEALELRDRLPRLWGRVMDGRLPAWKAQRVAEHTIPVSDRAAAWVDAQLEAFAHKLSPRRLESCVEAAVLRFEPERAAAQAAEADEQRGVWCEHHGDGTATVTARASAPDAVAFDHAVGGVAADLAALGDEDTLDVRRAKAVGVLADPQSALALHSEADPRWSSSDEAPAEERPSRPRRTAKTSNRPTIHLHVHSLAEAAVTGAVTGAGLEPVVRVHAPGVHGPLPLAAVEQWLHELAPGTTIKLTQVVDLSETIVADAYEAPAPLRHQAEERDHVCCFPWCGRRGRYDLDHIEEFVPLDDGGPPGQTNSQNLARLCRFHHRVKTHSAWDYRRDPDGSLLWISPLAMHYRVDPTGTTNL